MLAAKAVAELARFRPNLKREANATSPGPVDAVARRLGNTKAVCRKCYIHPAILDSYMDGATLDAVARRAARLRGDESLSPDEHAVVRLIERRLSRG